MAKFGFEGVLQTHMEVYINISDLPPDTNFYAKVVGPMPAPYWTPLKSDPWGNAQLIWRTATPGDYRIELKPEDGEEKVSGSGEFEVMSQNADEDRMREANNVSEAQVLTVEEPGRMGDESSAEMKADAEDRDDLSPEQDDPAFKPAESDGEPLEDPEDKPLPERKSKTSRKKRKK